MRSFRKNTGKCRLLAILIATLIVGCNNGAPRALPISSDGSVYDLSEPDSNLQNAFRAIRVVHPELANMHLMQINLPWVVGKQLDDETEFDLPSGRVIKIPADRSRDTNLYVCGTNGLTSNWVNSSTPPNCTDTGLFRRVYSVSAKSGAQAMVSLPTPSSMPTGPNQPDQISGFTYTEGWASTNAPNAEGGFQYSAFHENYNAYLKTNLLSRMQLLDNGSAIAPGGQSAVMEISSLSTGTPTFAPSPLPSGVPDDCSDGCIEFTFGLIGGTCPSGDICAAAASSQAIGWIGNCCTFGRMTTIARNTGDAFNSPTTNSMSYGPVQWSSPVTFTCVSGNCTSDGSFAVGGYQSYPTRLNSIVVSNLNTMTSEETDTINLPVLGVTGK